MKAWVVPAGRVGLTLAALAGLTLAQGSAGVLDLRTPAAAGTTAPQTALRAASMLCVGPELSGLKGAPDIAQSLTVDSQAAPPLVTGAQGPGHDTSIDRADRSAHGGTPDGLPAVPVRREGAAP